MTAPPDRASPSSRKARGTGTARGGKSPAHGEKPKTAPDAGRVAGSASQLIDRRIRDLDDWRGETLARIRTLIHEADPGITEEWKWNVPVWSHHGIVCTGESYAKTVKLTFAHGAALPDPAHLFNAGLGGNTRRAIDLADGEAIDAAAFKALVRAAVAYNTSTTA